MATRRGPHWCLDDNEKSRLGGSTIRLLRAYMPIERIVKGGPKLAFGMAVGLPVSKRLYADMAIMRMAMQQQAQQAAAAAVNQQWQDPAVPQAPPPPANGDPSQ